MDVNEPEWQTLAKTDLSAAGAAGMAFFRLARALKGRLFVTAVTSQ